MIKFDEVEYRGNLTKQIAAINKGYEYAKEITADGYSNCWWNNGNDVTLCGNCKTKNKDSSVC